MKKGQRNLTLSDLLGVEGKVASGGQGAGFCMFVDTVTRLTSALHSQPKLIETDGRFRKILLHAAAACRDTDHTGRTKPRPICTACECEFSAKGPNSIELVVLFEPTGSMRETWPEGALMFGCRKCTSADSALVVDLAKEAIFGLGTKYHEIFL